MPFSAKMHPPPAPQTPFPKRSKIAIAPGGFPVLVAGQIPMLDLMADCLPSTQLSAIYLLELELASVYVRKVQ